MVERLVAIVKPYQHKAGTWTVTLPKDLLKDKELEESLKNGTKLAVYWDRDEKTLTYRLPQLNTSDA
jgi:hypothetical protein